ncbi:FAS1 domain-containing protein [Haematococcus lacustris]
MAMPSDVSRRGLLASGALAALVVVLSYGMAAAQCPDCVDIPPDSVYTCAQQVAFNKCSEPFMANFCSRACGRCTCGSGTLAVALQRAFSPSPASASAAAAAGAASADVPAAVQSQAPPAAGPSAAEVSVGLQGSPGEVASATSSGTVAAPPSMAPPPNAFLDEVLPCTASTSILAYLQSRPDTNTTLAALAATGLTDQLGQQGVTITLFVPLEPGWKQLAKDSATPVDYILTRPDLLRSIAFYHVVPAAKAPVQLRAEPFVQSYWAGHLLFGNQAGVISGEGTKASITRSVQVCNSYVYLLDYVLLPTTSVLNLPPFQLWSAPPPPAEPVAPLACIPTDTAWFTINGNPNLTTAARLVTDAGLIDFLNNPNRALTLFVPDNAAWEAFNATNPALMSNPASLRNILLLHLLPSALTSAALPQGALMRSFNDQASPIYIGKTSSGTVRLQSAAGGDASVSSADLGRTCKAAVHVVNGVLNPGAAAAAPAITASGGQGN